MTPRDKPGKSPEDAVTVKWLSDTIAAWIARLGRIWVEGQIAQLNVRRSTAWITLRDVADECSLEVAAPARLAAGQRLTEGQQVRVWAEVEFWTGQGQLKLRAKDIRPVGIGELLAELERRKELLAAEGLFRPERKRALPFLPNRVGLICGRGSDAEKDVVTNAQRRWPSVAFTIREVAVQGAGSASQVKQALSELDADPAVDVIVITRGGGSVEDLLPFSDEGLIRAVAAATTAVVSAIGHEKDSPLLDLVADWRASTPTDAGKRIVPELTELQQQLRDLMVRNRRALANRMTQEERRLMDLRTRPVLTNPDQIVAGHSREIGELQARVRRVLAHLVTREQDRLRTLRASTVLTEPLRLVAQRQQNVTDLRDRGRLMALLEVGREQDRIGQHLAHLRALSPEATLTRGYAVVQRHHGEIVRDPAQVAIGEPLRVRVANGEFRASRTDNREKP